MALIGKGKGFTDVNPKKATENAKYTAFYMHIKNLCQENKIETGSFAL